jgi:hypothetical protein
MKPYSREAAMIIAGLMVAMIGVMIGVLVILYTSQAQSAETRYVCTQDSIRYGIEPCWRLKVIPRCGNDHIQSIPLRIAPDNEIVGGYGENQALHFMANMRNYELTQPYCAGHDVQPICGIPFMGAFDACPPEPVRIGN